MEVFSCEFRGLKAEHVTVVQQHVIWGFELYIYNLIGFNLKICKKPACCIVYNVH